MNTKFYNLLQGVMDINVALGNSITQGVISEDQVGMAIGESYHKREFIQVDIHVELDGKTRQELARQLTSHGWTVCLENKFRLFLKED